MNTTALPVYEAVSSAEAATLGTDALRQHFLLEGLMKPGQLSMAYTHYDRMMVGGAVPTDAALSLPVYPNLRAEFFLQRRELGIINVGGAGRVLADGQAYALNKLDALYVGRDTREVRFESDDAASPACFYLLSSPAHRRCETRLMTADQAQPTTIGAAETANHRTIYKYIHAEGIESCQLVMGLTRLHTGSTWNTMPAHVHDRRMEVYFYFDLPEEHRVFHLMGPVRETRHLVVASQQAVLSPPWSVHAGCGTTNYGFIWGMAGENQDYADMDAAKISDLR